MLCLDSMALNLNQLRIFATVLHEGSVTGAARALRVSQPAVSKQLAELELAVGAPLVDRLRRGVRPTAAGELLADHARRIFQEEAAAEASLAHFLGLKKGRLAVGASTTIGNYLVPQVFGELHRAFPGLELELAIGNTAAIQEQVLAGSLDVGLSEGLVTSEALTIEVFAHDEVVLIVSAKHPAARAPLLGEQQLRELPLVVRERGSGTRDVVEAALARRGLQLTPSMSLGSTEAVKNAVAGGLGAAFVSRLTVEPELGSGQFTELQLPDFQIRRALHLLTLRGKTRSPATEQFLRFLRATPSS
jgi:DNA-binding transcriptional LysR family regulator